MICLNTWFHILIVLDYRSCQYISFQRLLIAHWRMLTSMPNGKLVLACMWELQELHNVVI